MQVHEMSFECEKLQFTGMYNTNERSIAKITECYLIEMYIFTWPLIDYYLQINTSCNTTKTPFETISSIYEIWDSAFVLCFFSIQS